MAIPVPVPLREVMSLVGSIQRPRAPSDAFTDHSMGASRPYLSLTIFKGLGNAPINAHTPIVNNSDSSSPQQQPSRPSGFATSFSNAREPQAQSSASETVNVHAVSDDDILLPFIERPREVEELLFETKANESLMHRICRVFGGSIHQPTQRGVSENWDEFLEILIGVDRPILDDEDWLKSLEMVVMNRSPELWAQLQRCLGAESIVVPSSSHTRTTRHDSWAYSETHLDSSVSQDGVSSPATEEEDYPHYEHDASSVNIEALHELPSTFYKQPAGQIQQMSLHDEASGISRSGSSSPLDEDHHQQTRRLSFSSSSMFTMSHSETGFGGALADIMEEGAANASVMRPRSYSGKFAGLRISTTSQLLSSEAATNSRCSSFTHSAAGGRTPSPASSLPTGALSPTSSAGEHKPTSFSRHRRLSSLVQPSDDLRAKGNGQKDDGRKCDAKHSVHDQLKPPSHGFPAGGHQRAHSSGSPKEPRCRAMSFARSFAELHPGIEHHAHHFDDKSEHSHARPMTRHRKSHSISAGTSKPEMSLSDETANELGLLPDGRTRHPSAGGRDRAASIAAFRESVELSHSLSPRTGPSSEKGGSSPPIPGLLPGGRTRHPSGGLGSKDLSESIAAFQATMSLTTSPSPSEKNAAIDSDEATPDKWTALAQPTSRKRKELASEQIARSSALNQSSAAHDQKTGGFPGDASASSELAAGFHPFHMHNIEKKHKSGGSGLALGGGFSLAKSGVNYKKPEAQARTTSRNTSSGYFSFRSPPSVSRRPGGFASLAQEYESARRTRRSATESSSVFSFHSNAIASSPGSSIASVEMDHPPRSGLHHDSHSASSPRSRQEAAAQDAKVPVIRTTSADTPGGQATPRAGQQTPRASTSMTSADSFVAQFPFPAPKTPRSDDNEGSPMSESSALLSPDTAHTTPSMSPQRPRHLEPSFHPACFAPRSPSIIFPISPNLSVSRAKELARLLATPEADSAFHRIAEVCGNDASSEIRQLLTNTERHAMPDEALLEMIGKKIRLVDHERALQVGGREREEAYQILAEEGYEDRWDAFSKLCSSLGVGDYEIGMAKRRCGPAIDLSGK